MQQQVSTVGVGDDQRVLSPEAGLQVGCNGSYVHVKVELLKLPNRLTPQNIKAPSNKRLPQPIGNAPAMARQKINGLSHMNWGQININSTGSHLEPARH